MKLENVKRDDALPVERIGDGFPIYLRIHFHPTVQVAAALAAKGDSRADGPSDVEGESANLALK